jgi:hypothetical protein
VFPFPFVSLVCCAASLSSLPLLSSTGSAVVPSVIILASFFLGALNFLSGVSIFSSAELISYNKNTGS